MKKTIKKMKPAELDLDRSRTEQALRNSELRYRRLFETAQDGILILDAETGAITDVNPYLIAMLGYSRAEFIEKKLWQVGAFKDIQASKDAFEALQKNEYIRYENLPLKAKGGRLIQVEFVSNAYLVGGEKVIQCNIRDITEHKRLVAAMQENEKKYHDLVNHSPDGIFIIALSGNILAANQAMCDELEFTEEEFRSMNIWDIVPDEYLDQYRTRLTKILNGESLIEPSEYSVRGKDGKILYIEVISAPYYSEKGIIGFQGIARDITRRKRAEETLRESEERFRSLIENASDLVLILNPDYTIAYVSPSVERILGHTVAAVVGARITDFIYPQDLPDFIAATEHRVRTPGPSPFSKQVRVCHADGSWRTLEGMGNNVLDQPGVSGLVINARDITARKRAEEALREHEERLTSIYNTVGDIIFQLAVEKEGCYRFASVNSAFFTTTGLTSAQVVGKRVDEVIPEPSLSMVLEKYAAAIREKGTVRWEETSEYPTGRLIGEVSIAPVFDEAGHCTHLVGAVHDITERKRAEEGLRESEERNRDLVEHSQDLICTHDLAGKILSVNPAAIRITGYSENELVGMNLRDALTPEFRERFADYLAEIKAKGSATGLMFVQTKGGEKRVWEYDNTLRTQGVAIPIVRGTARDITERKRAEETLRASKLIIEGIINAIPVRVFWKDKNLVYLGCNAVFARDAGFTDPKDIIGKDDYQMGWRDQAELYRGDDRQVIKSGCSKLLIEEPQTNAEGNTITLLTSKVPLRDSKGEISGILGTYMDITERKRAEEELRALSTRQEAILAAVPDILMEVNKDKVYTWANPAGVEFFGEAIIGKEAVFYFAGEQDTYGVVKPLFNGSEDVIYVESWQRRKDGEKRLLAWWCRVLKDTDGNVTGALSSAHDITERKQAEEALRESEERYRRLIVLLPDGVVVHSEGRVVFANSSCARIIGAVSPAEMIGKPVIEFVHPEHRELALKRIKQSLSEARPAPLAEEKFIRFDGTPIDVQVSAIPFSYAGKPAMLTVFNDITERKRTEEEIKKQLEELQRWQKATLGRETRVLDLKREVNELLGKAGQPPRYSSVET